MTEETRALISEINQSYDRKFGPKPQDATAGFLYDAFRMLSVELEYVVLKEGFDFGQFDELGINDLSMGQLKRGYSAICGKLRNAVESNDPTRIAIEDFQAAFICKA